MIIKRKGGSRDTLGNNGGKAGLNSCRSPYSTESGLLGVINPRGTGATRCVKSVMFK